ncbi:DUF1176 domain-containing protein [Aeromonas crassostreae]
MRSILCNAPLVLAAGWLLAPSLAHAAPDGMSFQHKEWELACDNTLTCRAAGYSAQSGGISVLLTREGGPDGRLDAEMVIADYPDETPPAPTDRQIELRIQGAVLGTMKERTPFDPAQTEALVRAIKGTGTVVFQWGYHQESLSGAGAYAVLLKMDEFQGRLGTVTALTKRGNQPAGTVPPALPAPTIHGAQVAPDGGQRPLTQPERHAMMQWLNQQVGEETCDRAQESGMDGILHPFDETRVLIELPCWMAAYNYGAAFVLISADLDPRTAVLISTDANGYHSGELTASHKGRGLGDCWSNERWVWDGQTFVPSNISTTGSCRLIAAGGTWDLPTLTTRVVKAP